MSLYSGTQGVLLYVGQFQLALLSILGSSFVLITSIILPHRRRIILRQQKGRFPLRLIFCLSCADLLTSFSYIFWGLHGLLYDKNLEGPLCTYQGFSLQAGFLAGACISIVMSIEFYQKMLKNSSLESLEGWIMGGILAYVLTTAILPLLNLSWASYGNAGVDCWMPAQHNVVRHIFLLIPLYVSVAVVTLICLTVFFRLRAKINKAGESLVQENRRTNRRLLRKTRGLVYYPIASAIMWLPGVLINRVIEAVTGSGWLPVVIIHAFSVPSQGIYNFLIYASTSGVWRELRAWRRGDESYDPVTGLTTGVRSSMSARSTRGRSMSYGGTNSSMKGRPRSNTQTTRRTEIALNADLQARDEASDRGKLGTAAGPDVSLKVTVLEAGEEAPARVNRDDGGPPPAVEESRGETGNPG